MIVLFLEVRKMKGRRILAGIVGVAMLTSAFSFGVFADENETFICDNAVTAVRICLFDLISQIDILIFQKPDRRSVGKGI